MGERFCDSDEGALKMGDSEEGLGRIGSGGGSRRGAGRGVGEKGAQPEKETCVGGIGVGEEGRMRWRPSRSSRQGRMLA